MKTINYDIDNLESMKDARRAFSALLDSEDYTRYSYDFILSEISFLNDMIKIELDYQTESKKDMETTEQIKQYYRGVHQTEKDRALKDAKKAVETAETAETAETVETAETTPKQTNKFSIATILLIASLILIVGSVVTLSTCYVAAGVVGVATVAPVASASIYTLAGAGLAGVISSLYC